MGHNHPSPPRISYATGLILATLPSQASEIDIGAETHEEFVMKSSAERLDLSRLAF